VKAIKKEIMKAMKKDYSEGYEERNNEDYEDYNEGYKERNNEEKTITEAMKKEIMKAMKKDYSGGYKERNNEEKTMVKAMKGEK